MGLAGSSQRRDAVSSASRLAHRKGVGAPTERRSCVIATRRGAAPAPPRAGGDLRSQRPSRVERPERARPGSAPERACDMRSSANHPLLVDSSAGGAHVMFLTVARERDRPGPRRSVSNRLRGAPAEAPAPGETAPSRGERSRLPGRRLQGRGAGRGRERWRCRAGSRNKEPTLSCVRPDRTGRGKRRRWRPARRREDVPQTAGPPILRWRWIFTVKRGRRRAEPPRVRHR